MLYSKGADSKILSRLCDDADASVEPTNRAVAEWGEDGLRTLVFAYRLLTPADFERFFEEFHRANADVQEKAKHDAHIMPNAVDDAMDSVERELVLLGATANEDELQDGVPDTIATLSEAGIKVWMLTGDKMETAVNIAFATQLVRCRARCCRALRCCLCCRVPWRCCVMLCCCVWHCCVMPLCCFTRRVLYLCGVCCTAVMLQLSSFMELEYVTAAMFAGKADGIAQALRSKASTRTSLSNASMKPFALVIDEGAIDAALSLAPEELITIACRAAAVVRRLSVVVCGSVIIIVVWGFVVIVVCALLSSSCALLLIIVVITFLITVPALTATRPRGGAA